MTNPILTVEGLAKTYPGRPPVTVISDIGFSIGKGEVVGLVGESGSGKTTIGRSLLRLIEPSAGRVIFDGQDLRALAPAALRAMRARMQYVFQDPYASLSPRMTVREILTEGLRIQGVSPAAERNRRAAEALEQVELDPTALDRYPHEFSGGQRQRIGIARALALAPDFIVADEPVSALDVSVQAQMINLLRALRARLGLSMLFISHDLAVVEYLCDRVITLYLGRIMEIAPTDAPAAHPYTAALRDAVPDPDPSRHGHRNLLAGDIPSLANPPSGCVFRTRCPLAGPDCAAAIPKLREVAPGQFSACIREKIK